MQDREHHPSECQLREPAEPLVSGAASSATVLPQMQEQPCAEGRCRWQRAYGPQQALEVIGIAQPALGHALGTEPRQAAAGNKALVRGETIGGRISVREDTRQHLPSLRSGFQGEGDPGTRQRPDQ